MRTIVRTQRFLRIARVKHPLRLWRRGMNRRMRDDRRRFVVNVHPPFRFVGALYLFHRLENDFDAVHPPNAPGNVMNERRPGPALKVMCIPA